MSTATLDKSGSRVRRMFGEIAPHYDRMNHLLSMNVDKYWRWFAVKKLNPQRGEPILDVCTGTGDLALAFEKYTGGQSKIVASDFCGEMLEIGRAKRDRAKIPAERMEFVEADAQQLPFESDRFAVVSVAFGLRNVADTDLGLRELMRVCKPGGQVAVLEFSTPTWQPFKGVYGFYFRNVLPRLGQMLARNSSAAYEYLPQSVGLFPQGKELADKMQAAGLKEVRWYPLTFGIATLYIGRK